MGVSRVLFPTRVLTAEKFPFHRAPQRGRDFRIAPEVRERLMEPLRDNGQLAHSLPATPSTAEQSGR
jgi:hypothetical protein